MISLVLLAQLHAWCWQPADGSDMYCGFNSYLECTASNRGRQGTCITNPTSGRRRLTIADAARALR
jgi:hypothetical protein